MIANCQPLFSMILLKQGLKIAATIPLMLIAMPNTVPLPLENQLSTKKLMDVIPIRHPPNPFTIKHMASTGTDAA